MAKTWQEVRQSTAFKALPDEAKEAARNEYFNDVVAPQVDTADLATVRAEFDNDTKPSITSRLVESAAKAVSWKQGLNIKPLANPDGSPMDTSAVFSEGIAEAAEAPSPPAAAPSSSVVRSFAPVKPELRAQIEAAWDAATPAKRAKLEATEGALGQILRERSGVNSELDQQIAVAPSLRQFDPRVEARRAELIRKGEDPRFADVAANVGARAGLTPGVEVAAMNTIGDAPSPRSWMNQEQQDAAEFSDQRKAFTKEHPYLGALASGSTQLAGGLLDAIPLAADVVNRYTVNPVARAAGLPEIGRAARLPGAEYFAEGGRDYSPEMTKKKLDDLQSMGELGDWIGQNVAQNAGSVAGSVVAATYKPLRAAWISIMGVQSAGHKYAHNKAEGADSAKAQADAIANGMAEALGEVIPLKTYDYIKGFLRGTPQNLQAEAAKSLLRRVADATGVVTGQMLSGAAEEGLTQVLQNVSEREILGKKIKPLDHVAESAVIGAFMEGPLSAGHAANALRDNSAQAQAARALREQLDAGQFTPPSPDASSAAADAAKAKALGAWSNGLAGAPRVAPPPLVPEVGVLSRAANKGAAAGLTVGPAAVVPDAPNVPAGAVDASALLGEEVPPLAPPVTAATSPVKPEVVPAAPAQALPPVDVAPITATVPGSAPTALEAKYEAAKAAGDNEAMRKLAHEINAERQKTKAPKAPEPAAAGTPPVLSLGAAPNSAEPITVRDGVVHIGNYAAQDFDSGEDVRVDEGATPHQIRDALAQAGVIGKGQKVFGLPKGKAPNAAAAGLTVPPPAPAAPAADQNIAAAGLTLPEQAKTEAGQTIDAAAHEAASSPLNDKPEPTEAQKHAGNYVKGHARIAGFDVAIENPQGSVRSGTDPNGKPWSNTLQSHYGYIKRTNGNDGDQLDVFIKPGTAEDYAGPLFVVDQKKANGQFDEHKVMLGYADIDEAKAGYLENYAKGWDGMKTISATPLNEFKDWLANGDTKKPFKDREVSQPKPEAAPEAATSKDSLPVAEPAGPAPVTVRPAGEGAVAITLDPSAATKPNPYAAKWFGSKEKADGFIAKQGASATHRAELKDGKWLIVPQATEAEKAANRAKLAELTAGKPAKVEAKPAGEYPTIAKAGDVLVDDGGENDWQIISDVLDAGDDVPLRVIINRGLLSERQKAITVGELKARIAEDKAFRDQFKQKRVDVSKESPSVADISSGKALADRLTAKIDEWVSRATNNGSRAMDHRWEIGAVERFKAAETHAVMSGKQIGHLAAAKIAIAKARTFDELRAAVGRLVSTETADVSLGNEGKTEAKPAEDLGAMFDDLMGEIGAGAEVSKAANRNKLAELTKPKAKKPVTPQVVSTAQFNSVIQIAADSVKKLRKPDVDRVLAETPAPWRLDVAGRIKAARPDLADEVDSVLAEAKEAPATEPAGTRHNGEREKLAADRLQQVLDQFTADRATPEGAARAALRSVVDELRKPRTAVSVDDLLTTAAQRMNKKFSALADVVYEVAEGLNGEAPTRTAGAAAVSAAQNTAEGFQNAIAGLGKLFGGNGRLSSGLTFDEETYQQAKPLFAAAAANFKQAGADLKDVMKAVMLAVREQFGDAVLGNMKPYVVRFIEDVRDGEIDYAGSKESTNASDLQTNAVPERGTDETEADATAGDRDREPLGAGLAGGRVGTDRGGAVPGSADQSGTAGAGSAVATGDEPSGPARDHSGARAESGTAAGESDHVIDADDIGKGGLTKKYRDNVAAIKIIKAMEAEGRVATPEERKQIARYVGWGALKGVFDPDNKQWAKQHEELKALLTDAEFAAARKSMLDAHYTSAVAVGAMYDAFARLGVTGGRILEPSVGIGNFFGLMPAALRNKAQLHGVELDSLTARLVSALYPKAKITQSGFEDFSIPAEYFDAVIGNPPFGSQPLVDAVRSAFSGFSIHNYFLAKGIHTLRPGGIMQVVVSHSFLDAQDSRARDWIAARADLIGGVRLPNTAFRQNAGTDVVTDILIFQKRAEGQPAKDTTWTTVVDQQNTNPKTGETVTHKVGAYFVKNPSQVLGKPSAAGSMRAANEYTVEQTGDIKEGLAKWVATLPENIFTPIERKSDRKKTVDMAIPDGIKEGSFYVAANGEVMQRGADLLGEKTAAAWAPKNAKAGERMKGMITLRDTLRQQMRLERSLDATEEQIEGNRQKMNALYDRFLKDFGHLNNTTNRGIFLDDTEAHLLQALEFDYDKGIGEKTAENEGIEPREPSAIKADIFDRRVAFPPQDSMVVTTAKDALLASLNYRGKVDPDYMAEVYQKPIADIVKELDTLLFEDPQGGLATADEYLSGDVKTKLAEAVDAAKTEPQYRRNVEALEKVIPADKAPSEIAVNIGAPYVPVAVYQQFLRHISGGSADLSYIRATGQWSITFGSTADPALNTGKFGTSDLSAQQLFALTTLGRGAVVKETVKNPDGSTTTYVKEKETEAAREKQNAIKAEWQKWLWEDAERADQIAAIYNDKMNRIVNRQFDGGHLTFPGMNPGITLLEHQKNGVWRGLQSFQTLYDHVVGAGKTFIMATLAVEMRRVGVARKPLFVVPNHLTMQWRSEFTRLYPGSNVLAATPEDFGKGKRERLFSKMVTGDWDAIVIGHSSLKRIGLPEATEKAVLEEQIKELADAIEETKRGRGDRNIIRDMEGIKARLEAKMKNKLAAIGTRDKVLTFDELGIDAMFVDEMHEFKNLSYNSTMDRVAGMGNPNGSSKAFDMFVKVRWLFDTFGDQTPFITATGTPVSNSLVEMFNMQRYMQYPSLKRDGLNVFDAWARQFGKVESVYEVAPSGSGYRQSNRFSKFTNLPALMGHYNTFADTITLDDLKAQEEAQGKVFPVPKLVGGKPQNIVAKRSPQVAALMGVPKAETNEQGEILFNADLAGAIEIKPDPKSGKYSVKVGEAHLGQAETEQEARLKVVESALSPKITVDPLSILGRFGNLRQLTKESKGKINALSLTGEANKAGLDFRLINPAAPDFPGSKINLAVGKMIEVYHQWATDKGAQLVFCDLSIPLSARASYESQARRLYVKVDGELAMKRGTMHTAEGFESLPFFIIPRGEKEAKRFDVFDAASGLQLMSEFRTKADAKDAAIAAVTNEAKRQKWIDARHAVGEIEQEAIDDYNNDNEVETEGAEFFTREDIAGVSGASKFSVYDDIKAKLIAQGVPEREIAFIHDYSTPTAKAKLFAAVNTGEVRFLLGSTPKMGAGTNVQKRLVGLHHIDAPWRPSDLEQREGRIIRRDNQLYARDPEGFEVFIGRYATEQTYDTRRWQLLEHKARGIEQLRNYDGTINEIDDIEGEAANSADMKAAASGDPLILEETRARNDVHRLEQLQSGHADEVLAMNRKARFADQFAAEEGPKRVAQLEELIQTANQHPVKPKEFSPVAVNGKQLSTKEGAEGEIVSAFEAVRAGLSKRARIEFRGMKFNVSRPYSNSVVVSSPTDGAGIGTWTQSEAFSPSGFIQRLHNYVDRLPAQLGHVKAEIAKETKNAAAMREQAKLPFAQAGDLTAAREKHKTVQRALLRKGPTVPESQKPAVMAAIAQQKARLEALGFGDAVRELMGNKADDAGMFSRAYHGSPHDHDGFDSSKIGTGEGAQAYGRGHYFAGRKEVAEYYKSTLGGWDFGYANDDAKQKLAKATNFADGAWSGLRQSLTRADGDAKKAASMLRTTFYSGVTDPEMRDAYRLMSDMLRSGELIPQQTGRLYTVELKPAEDEYLLWDKPLSDQSEKVKAAFDRQVASNYQRGTRTPAGRFIENVSDKDDGATLYQGLSRELGSDKVASEYLHSLGIRGIKYLDGTSRSAGEGDFNYVIFDDADIEIESKYARGKKAAGQSAAAVRAEVAAKIGKSRLDQLERKGLVKIHATMADMPEAAQKHPDTWGYFDGKAIHLVASNLAEGQAAGVFQHEAWHAALRALRLSESPAYAKIMDRLGKIEQNGAAGKWFAEAEAMIPAEDRGNERRRLNELAAYAIQQYESEPKSLPMLIRRFVEDLIASVRAFFMESLGWVPANLTAADLAALTRRYVKAMATGEPAAGPLGNEAMASREGNPKAAAFEDPAELAHREHEERADQYKLTAEQRAAFRPKVPADKVTGFFRAEEHEPTILRAKEYAEANNIQAFYVEADVSNLGGINDHFDNSHAEANKVFRVMTDVFREEMERAGAKAVVIRHGGDEVSAILMGSSEAAIQAAVTRIKNRIQTYAIAQGLSQIKHPKGKKPGIGLYLGHSLINGNQLGMIDRNASEMINTQKNAYQENQNVGRTQGAVSGRSGQGNDAGRTGAGLAEPPAGAGRLDPARDRNDFDDEGHFSRGSGTAVNPKLRRRGILDTVGQELGGKLLAEKITGPAYNKLIHLLTEAQAPAWVETIRAGVLSDYGLSADYLDRKVEMEAEITRHLRKAKDVTTSLSTLTRAESRVAYEWMNASPEALPEIERDLYRQLPEESRTVLDGIKAKIEEMSQEALRLGQLSPEAYARNKMAYIHRSYAKHVFGEDDARRLTEIRGATTRVIGDQYKGRGMFLPLAAGKLEGPGDNFVPAVGQKFVRLERRNADGKVLERRWWPAGQKVPGVYADLEVDTAPWEVRALHNGKSTVWRDFTKEERQRMGELDEVKFAVATTISKAAHDIEVGRFFEWVAGEYGRSEAPEGATAIKAIDLERGTRTMLDALRHDTWVAVPDVTIPGTAVKKYGALSGQFVPGPVWNDIRQLRNRPMPFGETYAKLLRLWKMAKTALSPAVHMNNVMANVFMADMHDVGARDVLGALTTIYRASKGNADAQKLMQRFEESGALSGTFVMADLKADLMKPLLDELRKEVESASDETAAQVTMGNVISLLTERKFVQAMTVFAATKPARRAARLPALMIEAYQMEDSIFRLAAFMRAIDAGQSDREAGKASRSAFLDYNINAPWIANLRHTVLPFVAFTYRMIPMALEIAAKKPWKFAKYALVINGLSAASAALFMAGDDEEEWKKVKKMLPDDQQGKTIFGAERLIPLGKDQHGRFLTLNITRWMPLGDMLEVRGESSNVFPMWAPLYPGGPGVAVAEVFANRSVFSGREIWKATDTPTEQAGKVSDHLFKQWLPNVPIPNPIGWLGDTPGQNQTYSWAKIEQALKGSTDQFGRQYSLGTAALSSVGVKVAPYAIDALKSRTMYDVTSQEQEIRANIRRLQREHHNGALSQAAMERQVNEEIRKLRDLEKQTREKVQ